jgi:hypothetical protein
MNSIFNILITILLTFAIIGVSTGIYMTSTASGKVDYCYVHESQMGPFPLYTLVGHRSWRGDRNIVSATSYQEIVSRANDIKCPIGVGH